MVLVTSHTHNIILSFFHGGEADAVEKRELARVDSAVVQALTKASVSLVPATIAFPGQHYSRNPDGTQSLDPNPTTTSIQLTSVKIGDVAMAAVEADIASAIGEGIRAQSPFPNTMVISMLGPSVGYVLTDEQYEHPGHAVYGSPVQPGYAEKGIPLAMAKLLSD